MGMILILSLDGKNSTDGRRDVCQREGKASGQR